MSLKNALALAAFVGVALTCTVMVQAQQSVQQSEEELKKKQERAKPGPDHKEQGKRPDERAKAAEEKAKADLLKEKQNRAKADQDAKAAQEKAALEQKLRQERAKAALDKAALDKAAADRERGKAQDKSTQEKLLKKPTNVDGLAKPGQEKSVQDPKAAGESKKKIEERSGGVKEPERALVKPKEGVATGAAAEQERLKQRGASERPVGRPGGEAKGLEEIHKQRKERVENGQRIVEEPDKRFIIKDQNNRVVIRHDETERLKLVTRDFRTERKGQLTIASYTRPDGAVVVSEVDDAGRLQRRYRRMRDGREIVLIDNRRSFVGNRGAFFVAPVILLPALAMSIPRERYIVEYSRASDDDLYDALLSPPLERLDRGYTLEEVRWSNSLRERMRRVDLDDINFESGSWEITSDQLPQLERLARAVNRVLDRLPDEVFLIEGHTDAVGSDEDNLTLSDRRAEAVAAALSQAFDVPPENLVTQGYGEQFLKIDTQAAERANRRVAFRRVGPLLASARD
jgi:outer membrane protein OmpA-like peptidoglycan-associated protein